MRISLERFLFPVVVDVALGSTSGSGSSRVTVGIEVLFPPVILLKPPLRAGSRGVSVMPGEGSLNSIDGITNTEDLVSS
jgi:hypothetical protein